MDWRLCVRSRTGKPFLIIKNGTGKIPRTWCRIFLVTHFVPAYGVARKHPTPGSVVLRVVGPDKEYVDYFQGLIASPEALSNLFGIRVRPEFCSVIAKNGDGHAKDGGEQYPLPLQ